VEKHVEDTVAGGTWIFLGSLAISLTGFVFWLVIARVAGVESVGIASATISSALMASTLTSAGMNIAVIREVASRGARAFIASLTLASIASIIAAFLSILLIYGLGYMYLAPIASLLAISYVLSIPVLYSLIGMERFRSYFTATLAGSMAKLTAGITLAALGLGALAPLLGYLAHPLTASLLALTYLSSLQIPRTRPRREELRSIATLALSNYPFVFSTQLLSMLSIYVFAYIAREAISVGTLYISMMITLAILAIPNSLLNAALPIGTRRNVDLFSDSFRIGLALSTPIIVAVVAAPRTLLQMISPELINGANVLRILLLSITPLTVLTATITKLNKERKTNMLVAMGVLLLSLLVALMIPLTKFFKTEGAALAFLIANTTLLPIALKHLSTTAKTIAIPWTLHITTAILSTLTPLNEILLAIAAVTLTTIAIHTTKIATLNELHTIAKLAVNTLLQKR